MTDTFHDQLYANLDQKDTEELCEIWQENDRTIWSDDAFGVIREILQSRTGSIPSQGRAIVSKALPKRNEKEKHLWLGTICLLMAVVLFFAFSRMSATEAADVWARQRPSSIPGGWSLFLGMFGIFELVRAWWESVKEEPPQKKHFSKMRKRR